MKTSLYIPFLWMENAAISMVVTILSNLFVVIFENVYNEIEQNIVSMRRDRLVHTLSFNK